MNLFKKKKERVIIKSGETFPWRKGLCLEAVENSAFLLPGAILVEGEEIGSIIEGSDDEMQIGFEPNDDGQGFKMITVIMKPGQSLALHRSSEVMHAPLTEKDKHPKQFIILKK